MIFDVKKMRKEWGFTLQDMATLFGCDATAVSRLQYAGTKKGSKVSVVNTRFLVAMLEVKKRGWDLKETGDLLREAMVAGHLTGLHLLFDRALHDPEPVQA